MVSIHSFGSEVSAIVLLMSSIPCRTATRPVLYPKATAPDALLIVTLRACWLGVVLASVLAP